MQCPKRKKPKTYFEQVPLEHVKDIADEDIQDDGGNGDKVTVEPPQHSGLHSRVTRRPLKGIMKLSTEKLL